MRNFNLMAALVGTAAIATLALAQSEIAPRTYEVTDNTTADTSTRGNPPVRCDEGLRGVGIKCSSNRIWQAIPRGGSLTIECDYDDGHIQFIDRSDTENSRQVAWGSCASKHQNVSITGTLSMCMSGLQLSAQSQCQPTSDTFNLQ